MLEIINGKRTECVALVDANGNILNNGISGSSAIALALENESVFVCHSFSLAAAGSGQYNQFQLWNPADSGKNLVLFTLTTWQTGVVAVQANSANAAISATEANKTIKNTTIGSSKTASAKIFTANTNTVPTAEPDFDININSQSASGATSLSTAFNFVIKPGFGLTFTQKTANIAANAYICFGEVDINE